MKCQMPIDPATGIALEGEALEAALRDPYSPRCGREIEDGDVFCPSCGARVDSTMPTQGRATCDVANIVPEEPEQDMSSDDERAEKSLDIGLSIAGFVISIAIAAGIMVWSVFLSSTLWLFILFCALLGMVEGCAECMINIYKTVFLDNGADLSSVKKKVLHWVCIFLLCIPLSPFWWGFIQGGFESIKFADKGKINLSNYFLNKSGMNLLTRVGYRWVYHLIWDFDGTEDDILETSPWHSLIARIENRPSSTWGKNSKDGDDNEFTHTPDFTLTMQISTAVMKNDYAEARRLARQISDKAFRDFELALIDKSESNKNELKKIQQDLERDFNKIEKEIRKAEAREFWFGSH